LCNAHRGPLRGNTGLRVNEQLLWPEYFPPCSVDCLRVVGSQGGKQLLLQLRFYAPENGLLGVVRYSTSCLIHFCQPLEQDEGLRLRQTKRDLFHLRCIFHSPPF